MELLIGGARRFELRNKDGQHLRIARAATVLSLLKRRQVGRKHQIIHEAGFEQSHHHRHLLLISRVALAIEADEASPPAEVSH